MKFDILAIGDTVTDAFINLDEKFEHTYKDKDGTWLAIPFGTKIPFDYVEVVEGVGNAANAAVACARLGLNSGLISNVGSDEYGRDMIRALEKNDVDTRFVRVNKGKISNYHYVLWYKEERTILIKHEEYDYQWPRFHDGDIPKWVYFSSISKNSLDHYHDFVSDWLKKHPEVKLAFQPGTFQLQAGAHKLKELYERTEVLIVNREEAVMVGGGKHEDVHDLFDRLHRLGPKVVVITDGPKGAFASDGQFRYQMPPYPDPDKPFERTGAGDAFASTFVAALIKGADVQGALLWAPINSMSVVQKVGAQAGLLTDHQIDAWLRKAPDSYHPTLLRL